MDELKEIRLKNNLSLQQIADILKISKTFYWQIENDKRRLTYDMAIRISEIFSLKPDQLFYKYFKNKKTIEK